MIKIGIIGGSGLENPELFKESTTKDITTKYGKPSSPLKIGKINNTEIVLIARHGKDHTITPSKVNNPANIQALKSEGCTHIIATTACGSLKKQIKRGDFIILDQFIDFTKHRTTTFFDEFEHNNVKHTAMAKPFNEELRKLLIQNCKELNLNYHPSGTVITIEGPRFSTIAESKMFKLWGADVINMSTAPECALANELEIPYASIAMSTDYDCWKEDEPPVTWDEISKIFNENVHNVINLLIKTIGEVKNAN
jgi:5'-methylthioadenosine phosphorylase